VPPVVTALRAQGRGRVEVELDGMPWRTLPVEPVLSSGLRVGCELDRPRARRLRRELRRAEALSAAGRVLRARDLSEARLRERLERRGVGHEARSHAVETLARAGLVDDRRVARARAAALADRGYGDAAIRWRLETEGFASGQISDAVATLEPERERAAHIVRARGPGPATARRLARRGFGEDAVDAAVVADDL
jgi:SOS response regulatory protein OraA/RecX